MKENFDLDKMYCGAIRRGDIFLFASGKKENAVVILQDNILNQGLRTVVCALIQPFKSGEEVFPNEVLLRKEETGLGKDGICMLHQLVTLDRRVMIAKKGELDKRRIKQIFESLDVNFGRFRDKE